VPGAPNGSGYLYDLKNVNGTLFFTMNDGHGEQLWRSDGTSSGTSLVADINSLPNTSPQGQYMSADVSGTFFFAATDGTHGRELWASDGTAAGTRVIADINPGSGDSNPAFLTNVSGTLFFNATDGVHGSELWSLPLVPAIPTDTTTAITSSDTA